MAKIASVKACIDVTNIPCCREREREREREKERNRVGVRVQERYREI